MTTHPTKPTRRAVFGAAGVAGLAPAVVAAQTKRPVRTPRPTKPPAFVMDFGWRVWHPTPAQPRFALPPGAVDAHCHVFGPGDVFPFAPERKYTPCDGGKDDLFRTRDFLGFSRNVIVQATCHGADNRAILDAVAHSGGRARAVATVTRDVSHDELLRLHAAGVRGVRFNFVKRLVDRLPSEELQEIAAKVAPLGWHIDLYFEAAELGELAPFFLALPAPLLIDHMGLPNVSEGLEGASFKRFLAFMGARPDIWCKVTCPERISKQPPPYADATPFARKVVETFPDRVMWGTDWPHPNMATHTPDDGAGVDLIPVIAPTAELQRKLLIDNPTKLYWSR
jgi:2-pyrone-4,6-dicarboxylate lactonase